MAGPNGGKRPGAGKPKGAKHKRTVECERLAEQLGINPFEILLLMSGNRWEALGYERRTKTLRTNSGVSYEVDQIEVADRIAAAHQACKYLFPQRKSIALDGEGADTLTAFLKVLADRS